MNKYGIEVVITDHNGSILADVMIDKNNKLVGDYQGKDIDFIAKAIGGIKAVREMLNNERNSK